MASIKMSLSEYDVIREELEFLRRVVKEITTPVVEDWNLDYARDNNNTFATGYTRITPEVKAYLEANIEKNTPEAYRSNNFSSKASIGTLAISEVRYNESKEEVGVDDGE